MDDARVAAYAYEQADLVRSKEQTKDDALNRIATRFPDLTSEQVLKAYTTGLFESR